MLTSTLMQGSSRLRTQVKASTASVKGKIREMSGPDLQGARGEQPQSRRECVGAGQRPHHDDVPGDEVVDVGSYGWGAGDAEDVQAAARRCQVDGLVEGRGVSTALGYDLRQSSQQPRDLPGCFDPRRIHKGQAQLSTYFRVLRGGGNEGDCGGAHAPAHLRRQKSDDPVSEDRGPVPRFHPRAAQGVQAGGRRLREGCLIEGEAGRNEVEVARARPEEPGKSPVLLDHSQLGALLAQMVGPAEAARARTASQADVPDNPLARGQAAHLRANAFHGARPFVTRGQGKPG